MLNNKKNIDIFEKFLNIFFICVFLLTFTFILNAQDTTKEEINKLFSNQHEVLKADEAFKFNAKVNKRRISLEWHIRKNCFLYESKFQFNIKPVVNHKVQKHSQSVLIDDEYFGESQVYFDKARFSLDFEEEIRNDFQLHVVYQGCNDKGFCYPEIKKDLLVRDGRLEVQNHY